MIPLRIVILLTSNPDQCLANARACNLPVNVQEIELVVECYRCVDCVADECLGAACEFDGGIDYRKFLHRVDQMDKPADKRDTWELDSRIRKVESAVESLDHKISEILRILGKSGEYAGDVDMVQKQSQ